MFKMALITLNMNYTLFFFNVIVKYNLQNTYKYVFVVFVVTEIKLLSNAHTLKSEINKYMKTELCSNM